LAYGGGKKGSSGRLGALKKTAEGDAWKRGKGVHRVNGLPEGCWVGGKKGGKANRGLQ